MDRRLGSLVVVALIGSGLRIPSASADLIEITFTGVVDQVEGIPLGEYAEIGLGTAWSLSYVFDSEAEDQQGSQTLGIYDIVSARLEIDDVVKEAVLGEIYVEPNQNFGPVDVYAATFWNAEQTEFLGVELRGLEALFSDDLPSELDWDAFLSRHFGLGIGSLGEPFGFRGIAETYSSRIIPVPATSLLLAFGLCVVSRRRRGDPPHSKGNLRCRTTGAGAPACIRPGTE